MGKCYIIDPHTRTVKEAHFRNYPEMKKLTNFALLDMVRVDNQMHVVYLDDEGMLKQNQAFFRIPSYPKPLAGRSLISRLDHEGEEVDVLLTLEEVKNMVTFVDTKVLETKHTQKDVHGVFFMSTEVIFDTETVMPHAE